MCRAPDLQPSHYDPRVAEQRGQRRREDVRMLKSHKSRNHCDCVSCTAGDNKDSSSLLGCLMTHDKPDILTLHKRGHFCFALTQPVRPLSVRPCLRTGRLANPGGEDSRPSARRVPGAADLHGHRGVGAQGVSRGRGARRRRPFGGACLRRVRCARRLSREQIVRA